MTGYRTGYRVPVAAAIVGGNSVCLFHLLNPDAAYFDRLSTRSSGRDDPPEVLGGPRHRA